MQRRQHRSLTPAQWQEHFKSHSARKQSLADYCRQHELAIATFRYWRSKLTADAPLVIKPIKEETQPTLVPVKVVVPSSPRMESAILTARLPNGATIEIQVTEKSFPWILQQIGALTC